MKEKQNFEGFAKLNLYACRRLTSSMEAFQRFQIRAFFPDLSIHHRCEKPSFFSFLTTTKILIVLGGPKYDIVLVQCDVSRWSWYFRQRFFLVLSMEDDPKENLREKLWRVDLKKATELRKTSSKALIDLKAFSEAHFLRCFLLWLAVRKENTGCFLVYL